MRLGDGKAPSQETFFLMRFLEWGWEAENHSVPIPGYPQHWVSAEKGVRAVQGWESTTTTPSLQT